MWTGVRGLLEQKGRKELWDQFLLLPQVHGEMPTKGTYPFLGPFSAANKMLSMSEEGLELMQRRDWVLEQVVASHPWRVLKRQDHPWLLGCSMSPLGDHF